MATIFEVTNGLFTTALIGRLALEAEQAQPVGSFAAGALDFKAEQGHRAIGEPAQQFRTLGIAQRFGVVAHALLHQLPVGNGGADVGQHLRQFGPQRGSGPRVGPVEIHVDDRFQVAFAKRGQIAF